MTPWFRRVSGLPLWLGKTKATGWSCDSYAQTKTTCLLFMRMTAVQRSIERLLLGQTRLSGVSHMYMMRHK